MVTATQTRQGHPPPIRHAGIASASKDKIMRQAQLLPKSLTGIIGELENIKPESFVEAIETLGIAEGRIISLQQRVLATRQHLPGRIRGMSKHELDSVERDLATSFSLINQIKTNPRMKENCHAAKEIKKIASKVKALLFDKGIEQCGDMEVNALVLRTLFWRASPDLTPGNRKALNEVSSLLEVAFPVAYNCPTTDYEVPQILA